MLLSLLAFVCCGAIVGVLAGLLGIGGGFVIVPILDFVFTKLGYNDAVIHQLALGTSLASILFTSISSARAHARRGAVHFDIVRNIAPGILAGTFLGGFAASGLPSTFLRVFFVCFLVAVSIQMLLDLHPKASRSMPGRLGTAGAGGVIGLLSSFVGIGGACMSVPFMTFCGVPFHHAVGTSSAIGFPIALAGSLGYLAGGWGLETLPSGCLGYVNLTALAGIACASSLTAPLGARLSHSLPRARLRKIFAVFLILVALRMTLRML